MGTCFPSRFTFFTKKHGSHKTKIHWKMRQSEMSFSMLCVGRLSMGQMHLCTCVLCVLCTRMVWVVASMYWMKFHSLMYVGWTVSSVCLCVCIVSFSSMVAMGLPDWKHIDVGIFCCLHERWHRHMIWRRNLLYTAMKFPKYGIYQLLGSNWDKKINNSNSILVWIWI